MPPRLGHAAPGTHGCRPLNRILVAQSVTAPQAWVSLFVAVQHIPACYFFIYTLGLDFLGAAFATGWSSALSAALLAGWVWWAGMGSRVWGSPSWEALQVGGGWVGEVRCCSRMCWGGGRAQLHAGLGYFPAWPPPPQAAPPAFGALRLLR